MKKNLIVFIARLFVYTVILFLLYSLIKNSIPPKFYFENVIYVFVFFFLVTLVFHYGLLYSSAKSNRSFISYYMIATALKLFLFLGIIIIYALLNRANAIAFISNFFVLYVFFTVFEVINVYRHFKSQSIEGENSPSEEIAQ